MSALFDSSNAASDHFAISTSAGTYDVQVANGLFENILSDADNYVFICDDFFADRVRARGIDAIFLTANEHTKSLDRMTEVICALRDRRVTRKTCLIAVGGGVVQDVAAFSSAIYMRGVEWIFLPTTLLSMADSCIGGKSSINVGKYKNIVGTIVPPLAVVIDPQFTSTLSREQKAEGLCEAAKICLCRGLESFRGYLACDPSVDSTVETLAIVIRYALAQKAWFIEIDEFDRKERLLLNFGHTFGHAIETASGYEISHGIAVGLGMIVALKMSAALQPEAASPPEITLFESHILDLLRSVDGLDDKIAVLDLGVLLDAFESDKKHSRENFVVILADEQSRIVRTELPRNDATVARVRTAFAALHDMRFGTGGIASDMRVAFALENP